MAARRLDQLDVTVILPNVCPSPLDPTDPPRMPPLMGIFFLTHMEAVIAARSFLHPFIYVSKVAPRGPIGFCRLIGSPP